MSAVDDKSAASVSNGPLMCRVSDAGLLLDYAVVRGVEIDACNIAGVRGFQTMADSIKRFDSGDFESLEPEFMDEHAAFDQAYRGLAAVMLPVSADTLRATDPAHGRRFLSIRRNARRSEAEIWSAKMWLFTGFALLMIGLTELFQELAIDWFPLEPDHEMDWVYDMHLGLVALGFLLPYLYGLLGACLFLLPKCYEYVSDRTFDPLRISEYKSRLLLGFVSGGIVMFFVHQIGVEDGDEVIQLSAPVLALIAGYNTDFIFQAIERIVAAILPKVDHTSARRAPPPTPPPPTTPSTPAR